MSVVVPFDNSPLARTALQRGSSVQSAYGGTLYALTVIPKNNKRYARERSWIEHNQSFDTELITQRLQQEVTEIAPDAEFRSRVVGRYSPAGKIAREIRQFASGVDASLVVIGSEDAGSIVSNVSSVGGTVAANDDYEVLIVRKNT